MAKTPYYKKSPTEYGMINVIISDNDKPFKLAENEDVQKGIEKMHNRYSTGAGMLYTKIKSSFQLEKWLNDEMQTSTDQNSSKSGDDGFTASDSIEHALDILKNGDPDMLKQIEDEAKEKVAEHFNLINKPIGVERDVEGMFFDVGLHLEGEPEAFFKSSDELVRDKCMTIDVLANYSCNTSASRIQRNIVNLMAAIQILEMSGHRIGINMWWISKQDDGYSNSAISYAVKGQRQALNVRRLVGTAHPSFFRRLVFRIRELTNTADYGYGQSFVTFVNSSDRENAIALEDDHSVMEFIDKIKKINE